MTEEPGRNDPCPCGSGKKYKKCCMQKKAAGGARALSGRVSAKTEDKLSSHVPTISRGTELLKRVKKIVNEVPYWERDNLYVTFEEKDHRPAEVTPFVSPEQIHYDTLPKLTNRKDATAPEHRFDNDQNLYVHTDEADYQVR